jgi:CRISPR/Cas system CMR subunit Cmr4 (Cas7 group RAMP superfamily)
MSHQRHIWDVSLDVAGPFLTQSTSAGRFGLDAVLARDPDSGQPMIPGTLVRGRLRQAVMELEDCDVFDRGTHAKWLGQAASEIDGEADAYLPRRRRLHVSDFLAPAVSPASPVRTRVRIDDVTGAAQTGMLQMIESPYAAGKVVTFTGTIEVHGSMDDGKQVEDLIRKALRWNPAFGAETGIGFGRAVSVRVQPRKAVTLPAKVTANTDSTELWLAVVPQEPFLLGGRRTAGNLFESVDVIPGSAIKGIIAQALREWTGHAALNVTDVGGEFAELGAELGCITIGHAFPTHRGRPRPVVAPKSIVMVKEKWCDVLHSNGPLRLDGMAPAFAVDWKGSQPTDISAEFGWPALARELRVRTKIDYSRRKASDQQLFAYEMIVPKRHEDYGEPIWVGRVDLSSIVNIENRSKCVSQLRQLLGRELRLLGKTKARTRFDWVDAAPAASVGVQSATGMLSITLQSKALMGDPTKIAAGSVDDFYRSYWREVAGDSLDLMLFFASQSLAGGYLNRRFQPGKPYRPFLLTDAGSVFLFKIKDADEAAKRVKEWSAHGLPSGAWVSVTIGKDWQSNPFRREEGFGAVAVDLACHVTQSAQKVFGSNVEEINNVCDELRKPLAV